MMTVPTYIAPSKIHGTGIYASEPIKKGTIVWKPLPELDIILTLEQVKALPKIVQDDITTYGFIPPSMPGHYYIEFGNGRFMNHSDSPNTDFSNIEDEGIAIRDIAKDEEITCNYQEFCLSYKDGMAAS